MRAMSSEWIAKAEGDFAIVERETRALGLAPND